MALAVLPSCASTNAEAIKRRRALRPLVLPLSGAATQPPTRASNRSAPAVGRGATRGRRDRADEFFTRTRPADLQSKRGDGGTDVAVATNYFEVISKPGWRLLQYRVDMKPAIEHTGMRKAMLYTHKDKLPKMIFDGTMMFTTARLTQDDKPMISTLTL